MGRNGVLDCLRCRCFSPQENPAPSSSVDIYADSPDTGPSVAVAASQHPPSRVDQQLPPLLKLVPLVPRQPDYAVGIDDQVNSIIQLLERDNETSVTEAVVLLGLGGTGKTTLADAVVATLDIRRWNFCKTVPATVSGDEEIHGNVFEKGHALIYMDNFKVSVSGEHLQRLLPNNCKKIRLLLTARDEVVADMISCCGIRTHRHHVAPLLSLHAMELLRNKIGVDGTMHIPQLNEILNICDGVPVVVERVGAYIHESGDKDEACRRVIKWSNDGDPFTSAEKYSIEKNGLLFGLDELPPSAKEAFLDICSFFNGWHWDKVSSMVGEDELRILRQRAMLLNKEECENKVTVRPIVLIIGRNMGKGKRFTSAHELSKVLEGDEPGDIGGIKGIWLEDNISQPFFISAKNLDLMHQSLRVLALGDMAIVVDGQFCTKKFSKIVYFQAGLIPYIPFDPATLQELRYLDWLPHNNHDLQLAKMSSKLKVLDLNGGRYDRRLETASVFERLRGLRILKLAEFKALKNLPEELFLLIQLEELDLSGCRKLVELPKRLGDLKALKKLSLRSCESLQQLPENFGLLSSLEELDLGYCSGLKELPRSFGRLSSLTVLILVRCANLNHLPDDIRNLSALVRIEFQGSMFSGGSIFLVSIPCRYIKLVKQISSEWCRDVRNLPKRLVEFTNLRCLDIYRWSSLERLPEGFGQLKSLADLSMQWCSSLQELSSDFHCLPSLQTLNLQWCEVLQGKWMDRVVLIKTLELVNIVGSPMLEDRWAEMAEGGESWRFTVRAGYEKWNWNNVQNMLNMDASKLLNGKCPLTDYRGEPFSLSTVAPNTLLLVLYHYPCRPNKSVNDLYKWKLLEAIVKHEHPPPFQMIYVGKCRGELTKSLAERIMAYAAVDSDAHLFFKKAFYVEVASSIDSPEFVLTEVVADEEGRKKFSTWKQIDSFVEFLLSKSRFYSHLQKLTEAPVQEGNVMLLRALFAEVAESTRSSIFVRNYTENMGVDELHGKTVLLLIHLDEHGFIDEHLFKSLTDIHSKAKTNDDMEILSIPIPAEIRGKYQWRPGSDLAGFESIIKNVPWPVLRNPWSLKTEAYYFLMGEYWGQHIPAILVVMEPSGKICRRNALPLVKRWGAEVYPFTEEKMKQLEQLPRQPRVDDSRGKRSTQIPLAPIPVSLSGTDGPRGGMIVDAPLDLRGTSGCPVMLPMWEDDSDLDPDDLSTQTAIIYPVMPPRYF